MVDAADARPWDAWCARALGLRDAARVELPTIDVVLLPALAVTRSATDSGKAAALRPFPEFRSSRPGPWRCTWSDEVVADVFA